jgi:hypothetical protein
LMRTDFDTWEIARDKARADKAHTLDNQDPVMQWVDPVHPARIAWAELVPEDKEPKESSGGDKKPTKYSILQAYKAAKERVSQSMQPRPTPEDRRRWDACLFWLGLDLATSFDQFGGELDAITKELGLEARLFALKPANIESLRSYLESRWRSRAAIHAAAQDPLAFLPPCGAHRQDAADVIKLLLKWIEASYGSGATWWKDLWWAVLLWSCGRLGPGAGAPKLNMEPNSASIASFVELFDLVDEGLPGLGQPERLKCKILRVLFASALEPYFEVYRSADPSPRKAHLYARENVDLNERDPRWEDRRIESHIFSHEPAVTVLEENVPWVLHRWGAALAEGLRDEARVSRASKAPRIVYG